VLFVFFERYEARQFLDRAGQWPSKAAEFRARGGRKPPQGGHASFVCHFLLQPAKIREVLKIEKRSRRVAVAERSGEILTPR